MSSSKQGEEEDTDVENLVLELRKAARAEAKDEAQITAMLAPLTAEERDQIAAAILKSPAGASTRTTVPSAPVTSLAEARRKRTRWTMIGVPLAAAAGLALVFALPSRHTSTEPPLPGYEVSALGGLKEFRGGEPTATAPSAVAHPERIGRDTELTVRLRPATAVEGALAVRAFVIEGTAVRELAPSVELAPSGAAEVHVRPGTTLATGTHATLRVLVGRPDDVKAAAPAEAAGTPAEANGRRWLTVPLDVVN
jgi:hypothetical protein